MGNSLRARRLAFEPLEPRLAMATASFQQGVSSYASTSDTEIRSDASTTSYGTQTTINPDLSNTGSGVTQGLLRFDNIFGNSAGQIPYNSTINSATLTVYVSDTATSTTISLYRMLSNWSESSTWDSLVGGISTNGSEAASSADATLSGSGSASQNFSSVLAALQAWSNGATNYGWAVLTNSTSSWGMVSSEGSTSTQRPRLNVDYTAPTPGFIITPTSGLTTTEMGGTATFTVELNSQPTANVTLGISSSDTTEGTVSTSSLVFTSANWSTPQTVTITGIDDTSDDGDIAYSIVTAAATSTDTNYSGLNPTNVSITTTDDDGPLTFSSVQRGSIAMSADDDGGATGVQRIVTLATPVDASKAWVIANVRTNSSTPENYYVTAVLSDDGTTVTLNNEAINANCVVDWEVVEFSDGVRVFRGTDTFGSADTTRNQTLPKAINLSKSFALVTSRLATTSLTIDEQATMRAQLTSTTNLALTRTESGTASRVAWQVIEFTDTVTTVQSGLTTIAAGATSATASFTNDSGTEWLVFSSRAGAGADGIEYRYRTRGRMTSSTQLTFDRLNSTSTVEVAWFVISTPNTTIQTGSEAFTSTLGDNAHNVAISSVATSHATTLLSARAGGGLDNDIDAASFTATMTSSTNLAFARNNQDSEQTADVSWQVVQFGVPKASFSASTSNGSEATTSVNIPVTLDISTDQTVTVNYTVTGGTATGSGTDFTLASGTLTFNPYETSKNIAITINNDFIDELDETIQITISSPTNATLGSTTVHTYTITDNDTAGVTVNPTSGLTTTEAGGTATFTIVLNSQPTANVTIGLSSSNTAEGTVSSSVTFTTANWNSAQTITVTGVNDFVDDGDIAYTIVTAAATSSDANYNGLNAVDVSVTNTDNDTAGITVNPTSGLTTTEAGGTATFTIVLNSQPTANVTIGLSSSNTAEGTVSTSSVTFTTANWNSAQTITVTGVNDFVDDGNIGYTIVTAAATSSDTIYNGLNASDVTVSNTDNDTAGFTVTPTSGLTTTEAGGTATFTIVLNSQPTANVTIGISSNDTTEGTVSASSLTFTNANWNSAQTITVTGVNDFLDDGDIGYTIVTAAATSSDTLYNGLNAPDVTVTNTDNDTAGFTVNPTSGLTTTEAGGTATFTIVLNSQPTADVTIGLSSSNTAEGTISASSVTFTAANWNSAQTITITGVNDLVDDGDIAYSIVTAAATSADAGYNGLNASDVSVTNTDNDTAGITVNPTSGLTTTEAGGTATFTIVLNSQPTANVTIGLSSSNTGEGTISASSVTFTAANWNTAQTITITGVNDFVDDGNIAYSIVTAAATSSDSTYNGINASDVSVTNTDNDTAGITVNPTSGLTTTEAGGTATFTIVLNSQPTANVTIGLTSSNTAEGTVSASSVTFTSANWNVAQTITVTGVNDFVDDGNIGYSIVTAAATSSDSTYNGINASDVSVTNTDNDTAGITVNPTSGLTTTEAGGAATFTIVLNSQPTADVTIGISSNNTAEGTVSTSSVTFTAANWNSAQTITVTGVNDAIDDGDIAYTILTAAATSADGNYNGVNATDVSVTNTDNDTAGITVTPTSGLTTTEAGGTATFTIVLDSQPTADVTIGLTSTNTAEGTVSTSSVTFTAANWNTAQTITVTGVNDFVDDGNIGYTIAIAAATSSDTNYNNLNASDVSVTNTDNDTAGITVNPTSGLTTTEAGGTATFTIVLNSQPTANVTIGLTSNNTAEGTVSTSSVTFTAANWNSAQTITITGVNDFVDDGNIAYSIVVAAATSSDANYNGLNGSDVSVTNTDNDTAGVTVTPTSGLTTTEAGGTATFTIVLNSQPTANVTIGISSNNTAEGTVSTSSVTFTTANWNSAQTITVTGVNDLVDDGNIAYTIVTAAATSSDVNYSGFNPSNVSVTNTDNDTAGFTVTPTSGLVTSEAGGAATFTIVLNSQPTADVTIGLSSSNTNEGTVSSASVTFTSANWNSAQTITVTGVDDFVLDGNTGYTIVTAAASSSDTVYNGLALSDVSVTNTDNETPGITVSPTSGLITTEAGGTATFTIVLNSQPIADVVIALNSSDATEGTPSSASITFTSGNWNTPQTVTVTGAGDAIDDGDIGYTIVTTTTSSDPTYNNFATDDVSVTNIDDELGSIIVTPTSGLTTTEAGGTATFTIELSTQPTADVTINLASSNTAEGTISTTSVTFTSANWNVPQTITITGIDDAVDDGDIGYTIVASAAISTDLNFQGVNAADVSVTNTDNDTAGITVTPTFGLTTTEAGGTATFTIVLDSQPTADVTIAISSTNTAEGTVSVSSVTFTAADWNTHQTITITGVDDDIDDGDIAFSVVTAAASSADGNYSNLNAANVSVTNIDDDTAGITVTPTSGLTTTETGGTATFTIVLDSQPTGDVTIALSSSNTAEGTISAGSVTFTAANWNTPQTITVTGVNDAIDDGDIGYSIVTAAATSTDANYNGLNAANVSVTNTDNDTAGITVTPTSGLTTTEAGGTATFTIVLDSQPTADVTINLSSSNTAEGTISASSVTFTAANWNTPQTITITGVNDAVDDGNIAYSILTAAATSSDANYNNLDAANVSVTNTDNDTAGITVTPTSGLTTTEAGGTATFTIVLDSQPTDDVTINLGSSNTAEGTISASSVTFTAANWNVAQTITITGVNDAVDDGNIAYTIVTSAATSSDTNYGGLNPANVSVTNTDDDTAGITVTPTSGLTTTEAGGTATFTIVLNSEPTADVTINLTSSNTDEGTISVGSVTFTAGNWNSAQTITITGVEDDVDDGDIAYSIVTAAASSADSNYNNLNASDVAVTNLDDDTAGITIAPVSGLTTTEAGGTATFSIVLDSQPTDDVTINLSSSNTAEGTVSANSVTFTAANWNVAQTITITGVDDDIDDGDAAYSIVTAAATSSDSNYSGLNAANVSVTNTDDETAGIIVTPTSGLTTTEAGGTATFTIVLNSQPTDDVTIAISSSNTAEGAVSASSVTFTAANWNTPQTITITGVDDDIDDGDVGYTILLAAASSSDPVYNGLNGSDVAVTNTDDDAVGITVTPISGLTTTEAGGTATFTIVLHSQPTDDVTIGLASSNTGEGTLSVNSVTFTAANWNVPQTITVTGVDEFIDDGDISYTIVTTAATSNDANYAGLNPDDVDVTNTDDDVAGITVTPTSGLITTETGGAATFTIVLDSQPTDDVTIGLPSSDSAEGTVSVSSVTFTAANWNIAQTITITGVDDQVDDGDIGYFIVTSTASSNDANYAGLNASDITVTNIDDDEPGVTVAPLAGLITTEGGGSANFTVVLVLNSQPSDDVVIAVYSSNPGEGMVSTSSITFTPSDWNTPQSITITGVDDFVDDGDVDFMVILAPATSLDPDYDGFDAADVSVTNIDDDTAGITIWPTSGLMTTEAGGTATFTVVLDSQPTDDVTIGFTSTNTSEGTVSAPILFTPGNWNIPQTVTVTGVNDAVADGDVGFTIVTTAATSTDPNYSGMDAEDVSVTNADNDTPGITIIPQTTLTTTETGASASFTIVLNSQPTGDVTIALSSSNPAEGDVSTSLVTFTAANWNVAQTITVTGVDDDIDDGDVAYTIVVAASNSTDANYDDFDADDVDVLNVDDDAAGITIAPTSGLTTTEAGGTATFTIVLNSQPTDDVTIALSSSNTAEGTISSSSVTFTAANWNVAQTITITGVDDNVDDGAIAYTIVTAAASSLDANYDGIDESDVAVTNTDDDVAGITVTPTSGLTTTEAGGTATFTILLDSQPTADVTIGLSSTNTAEGTVSAATVTFTAANWNVAQTVTITGVNDFVDDGDIGYIITTAAATSSDANYAGLNAANVSATNIDNDTAGITVTPTSGLTTTEAGGTATFTIVLDSQPTADVTIALSSSNTAEGTVSAASVTFTAANWNVAQTVTITGVDDNLDDGNISYTITTAAATSSDANYAGLNAANVSVTNIDNDAAGFTVTPTSGLTTTEAGGTATFTIILTSQPTDDVTIGLSSSNTAEGAISAASVTFTAANWNVAQTITITGVDDDVDDGDIGYTITTAAATSSDANYNGLNAADVSVTNTDDDTAGITVTPTSGLTTTEAGGTATFTIVLDSQPTADVTITLSSSNTTEGTISAASVTFTAANWNVAQTITITGVDDDVDDGDIAYTIVTTAGTSADTNYDNLNASDVSVTNTDDDIAGITVTPISGLTTTEAGGTATFTIVLDSQPTADVTIALSSSNTAEGTVSTATVTFTAANWNIAQTVTITGVDDAASDGSIGYTIDVAAATSADTNYDGLDGDDVSVTNTDDDTAGITVTPTSGLTTTEAGGTATFTIVLNTQPTADVTIALSSSNTAEGAASVASVTFTAANWNVAQTVTITGVDDDVDDGDIGYTIFTAAATSADADYNGLNAADVAATNTDDDIAGITVTPTSGLMTTEAGGTATFTIVLDSQPTADVTISLSSSNTAEGTVSASSVTFTAANWNIAQTITITGANDFVGDGDIAYTIVTAAATSSDANYNGLNATDVAATNIDNDVPGITIAPTSGLTTTEAGGTATFTIVLNTQPTADVTIALSSSNTAEGTISAASVTFTAANWNVAQTITITGVDDDLDDGDIAYSIITAAATSADANYNGVDPADVAITNTDDDAAGITVTPSSGLTTTEASGTATFTVVLDSQPTADVTIALSSSNTAEGTISAASVTFTAANWNVAQTITITGIDDPIDDGDVAYSIVTAVATSADANYNGIDPADVAVTNADNDVAGVTITPTTGLTTTEAGGTATFTIVLDSQPTDDVTIALSSSNTAEGTISAASVTFTAANWNVAQTITITGVDDLASDGSLAYSIVTAAATSTDANYNGLNAADVGVTNIDDDTAGFTVTPTSGLTTTEAGGTATFTIVLNTQPSADVTIGLSSSDTGEGTVSVGSVTFTAANWNVPQTITVTGADDLIDDGTVGYTIVTAAATSSDSSYSGLDAADVSANNTDDDTAGITVTAAPSLTTTEAGGTTTFTIVLDTQPTANVTIGLSSSNSAEGAPTVSSVTFTPANWNTPQTITVAGANDPDIDGDASYTIDVLAATSADPNYSGIDAVDVPVTNTDNDVAGITVTPTSGLTTTEAGGTATFTIVLNSRPTGDVTIALSSDNTAEGTISASSVTFTAANWNTPQTITVTGVDDPFDDGNIAFSILTAAATSTDLNYDGIDPADVAVSNIDNDTVGFTITPTTGLITTESGGTATFTIVLNSQPAADVTIGISSSDTTEGTVSVSSVTFTPANWNTPQTITVTGVNDALMDGNIAYTIATAAATSADTSYDGIDPANVAVTNNDNDLGAVIITPTSGLTTTESGGTATFTMVLSVHPTTNVRVNLTSSNTAEGTISVSSVTFTPSNWNVPRTITITGRGDMVPDGNVAYTIVTSAAISTDPAYTGIAVPDVSVTNLTTIRAVIGTDPGNPKGKALAVFGSAGPDTISVVLVKKGVLGVVINNITLGQYKTSGVARVVIYGMDGDDLLNASFATIPVKIDGGGGNDTISGGSGNDILIGGAGDDLIHGGLGRDIAIGGLGSDRMGLLDIGAPAKVDHNDLIIGGTTIYDSNEALLFKLASVWNSTQTLANRLKAVKLGVNAPVLNATTVFDDGAVDTMMSNMATDLYFAGLNDIVTNDDLQRNF